MPEPATTPSAPVSQVAATSGATPSLSPAQAPSGAGPASSGAQSAPPAGTSTGGAPEGGLSQQQAQGTQWQQPSFVPIHEALRAYGYELPQGLEGHAALQHLVLQAREAQELAQYGRQYMAHASQFEQWMRSQQEAQQGQRKESWWKAPEFDPSWRTKILRDPNTGELKPAPGADPMIVQKYLQALEHQQSFMDRFSFDPIGAIKPGLEELIQQVAQQVVQQSLGGYQQQATVSSFERQNENWLYQHDQSGALLRDQQGQPRFTAWGERFAQYSQALRQRGLTDIGTLIEAALAYTQRDFLASQQGPGVAQQQQLQQANEQARQQFLQGAGAAPGAGHQPQHGGSLAGAVNPQLPAQNGQLPLAERMRQQLKVAGITDDQVSQTLGRRG